MLECTLERERLAIAASAEIAKQLPFLAGRLRDGLRASSFAASGNSSTRVRSARSDRAKLFPARPCDATCVSAHSITWTVASCFSREPGKARASFQPLTIVIRLQRSTLPTPRPEVLLGRNGGRHRPVGPPVSSSQKDTIEDICGKVESERRERATSGAIKGAAERWTSDGEDWIRLEG
jgi:hypothetical protein